MNWIVLASAAAALLIIALATWFVVRDRMLRSRMAQILASEGDTGRIRRRRQASPLPIRDAADVRFSFVLRDVERAPGDWRSWFRLSMAYADAGDRKRARKAMRRAVRLFAQGATPGG